MIRTVEREARTRHFCDCGIVIEPGDYYLDHVASPHHGDLANEKWWRIRECRDCAERYGRALQSVRAGGAESVRASDESTAR